MTHFTRWLLVCCTAPAVLLAAGSPGTAGDAAVYYVSPIERLDRRPADLPSRREIPPRHVGYDWRVRQVIPPRVVLDGPGEAYVARVSGWSDARRGPGMYLAACVPERRRVSGLLITLANGEVVTAERFRIPATRGDPQLRRDFLEVKRAYYQDLLNRNLPGAAWFRHQVLETAAQLGERAPRAAGRRRVFGRTQTGEVAESFALISGGRALAENLQLDRQLPEARHAARTVPIDSIEGITVRPFDWKPHIKGARPETDPLAELIPHDQYALLFRSFQGLVDTADHAAEYAAPILAMAEAQGQDAKTRSRYERQLGLSLNQAARLFGPQLIDSVALTGADPYLRTGADVAVLFEAKDAEALRSVVEAQIAMAVKSRPETRPVRGRLDGVAYSGWRTPDRHVCSYVAALGPAVVVTNSLAQLGRLVETHKGRRRALASLDEYTFFRSRYRRGDGEESALLILPDDAIRRWCGPRWRIGAARRIRAAAVLSDLQAAYAERLVRGERFSAPLPPDLRLPDAGQWTVSPSGVRSERYGDLWFQTPIVELDLDYATEEEAALYRRWRDGYQRNWSRFFDPIAVRIGARSDRLLLDVTVMPLIEGTEYRTLIQLSRGASLQPDSGDPHPEALLHAVLAVNPESEWIRRIAAEAPMLAPQLRTDPLGWLGGAVAVYVDRDPFWSELAEAENLDDFLRENYHRAPIGVYADVGNGWKLTAFLAAVRAFVEQSAPGMTVWETRTHHEQPYVRVAPSERAKSGDEDLQNLGVFYAASGRGLVISLREDVVQRALDRWAARDAGRREALSATEAAPSLDGEHLRVIAGREAFGLLDGLFRDSYRRMMRRAAWANIPILNEWKRRFPERDPVKVHDQVWGVRLTCPGGGEYRWNEAWGTMESTVFGHPGQPLAGPGLPAALRAFQHGRFGLTFEPDGLRARAELQR